MHMHDVTTQADIKAVSTLAGEIWRGAFTSFISAAQIDYMLERFQSPAAIAAQIGAGARYQLVHLDDECVGYVSVRPGALADTVHLGNFDLRARARGSGLATSVMQHLLDAARGQRKRHMTLYVNKRNARAVRFYTKLAFSIDAAVANDIGAGFVMDDYRMLRNLD